MNRPIYGDTFPHQNKLPEGHPPHRPKLPLKTKYDTVPVKVDPETGKLYVPEYPDSEQKLIDLGKKYDDELSDVKDSISSINLALSNKAGQSEVDGVKADINGVKNDVESLDRTVTNLGRSHSSLINQVNINTVSIADLRDQITGGEGTGGALNYFKGVYSSVESLPSSGTSGDYAYVNTLDPESGENLMYMYVWDNVDNHWQQTDSTRYSTKEEVNKLRQEVENKPNTSDVEQLIEDNKVTYSAGEGISIVDGVISISYPNGDEEAY